MALTMLVATADVCAVVAHEVVGLSTDSRYASWQNAGWLGQAAAKAPALAAIVGPATNGKYALDILWQRATLHTA